MTSQEQKAKEILTLLHQHRKWSTDRTEYNALTVALSIFDEVDNLRAELDSVPRYKAMVLDFSEENNRLRNVLARIVREGGQIGGDACADIAKQALEGGV